MKKILSILLSLYLFSGCIHEYPNEDFNPALLTVEVGLELNLHWESYENRATTALRSGNAYSRRFIVEIRREGTTVLRQTVVANDFVTGQTRFTLPEALSLHALEYTLVVWTDYADTETADGLHYSTSDMENITINEPYAGNTDQRDCFYSTSVLDLRSYSEDATVQIELDMIRPLAKYRIFATDTEAFLRKIKREYVGETEFAIRFLYGFYYPVAFSAWEGKPVDSQLGITFDNTFSIPDNTVEEILLGFDYIFVNGTGSYIPLTMEISSLRDGSVIGRTSFNVPYQRGYLTTIRGRFLTAMSGSGGIGIDSEYDGDIDIDLDGL